MLRCVTWIVTVLGVASVVDAAALVSLVPAGPGDGVAYRRGEQVQVDFYVQMDAASPQSIRVRLLQFDLADSSPDLTLIAIQNHPQSDIGPFPFWNFGATPACAGQESLCGTNYFIDGSLPPSGNLITQDILGIAYFGTTYSDAFQLTLRQEAPTLVGSLAVVMPPTGGDFVLDVLNADNTDTNLGADLRYGFGMPWDPVSVRLQAVDGGIVMAPGAGTDEFGRVAFAVVPEPGTLTLIALGGAAVISRSRRKVA